MHVYVETRAGEETHAKGTNLAIYEGHLKVLHGDTGAAVAIYAPGYWLAAEVREGNVPTEG